MYHLTKIVADLKAPNLNEEKLKLIFDKYQELINTSTSTDTNIQENKENLRFDNGISIAPKQAASCLFDYKRSKAFILGVFEAIEKLKAEGKKKVHVFYAGTGPYATLLLPIMALYKSSFLQCTLLEINEISFSHLREVISTFGFTNHVKKFILADATKYIIESDSEIDILLSETMCSGLKYEQQVPILLNLVPQITNPFLLIPQNISLTLAFMKDFRSFQYSKNSKELEYCRRDQKLLDVNCAEVNKFHEQIEKEGNEWKFPTVEVPFSDQDISIFHNLVVLTEIQVFDQHKVGIFESDITRPVSVIEFEGLDSNRKLSICYKIDSAPGYNFELK